MLIGLSLIQRIVGGVMLAALLIVALLWQIESRRAGKLQDQLIAATAELKRLSSELNEQKSRTDRNMVETRTIIKEVEVPARRVEQAKPIGNCEQPKEVRDAEW